MTELGPGEGRAAAAFALFAVAYGALAQIETLSGLCRQQRPERDGTCHYDA